MLRNKFWVKSIAFTLFVLIICMSSINITSKTIDKRNNTSILDSSIPLFKDPPNEVWNKTFGGSGFESGEFIQQTSDNGYIIVGYTRSFGAGNFDVWLIKTDIDGNELWNKTYGGPYEDLGYCVRETADGGFIIVGTKDDSPGVDEPYCLWLIKTDENGDMEWENKFKIEDGNALGQSVIVLDDGYLVMAQIYPVSPFGEYDIWLIKTDFNGNEQWNKFIGDSKGHDICKAVIQTSGGDFVIVGWTFYYIIGQKVLLIKTDSNGNNIWRKELDGWEGSDIIETDAGDYIIAGKKNVCLIKTDKDGNKIWMKGYDWGEFDGAYSVDYAFDGGYIVAGTAGWQSADVLLQKTDKNGNKEWERVIGGPGSQGGNCVIQSNDETYVILSSSDQNVQNVWLIKVAPFENQRPTKPSKPEGPTDGSPWIKYNYTTGSSIDPDGDQVWYTWVADDMPIRRRVGPYLNGETCEQGIYFPMGIWKLRVKAFDIYGGESELSDPLTVTIPRNRITPDSLLMSLIERFPLLGGILLRLIIPLRNV